MCVWGVSVTCLRARVLRCKTNVKKPLKSREVSPSARTVPTGVPEATTRGSWGATSQGSGGHPTLGPGQYLPGSRGGPVGYPRDRSGTLGVQGSTGSTPQDPGGYPSGPTIGYLDVPGVTQGTPEGVPGYTWVPRAPGYPRYSGVPQGILGLHSTFLNFIFSRLTFCKIHET